jgi:hypothetical protein
MLPVALVDAFGNVLVLPLAGHIRVDHGIAYHFLVRCGQLLEEGIDLVLKVAIAFSDRTLDFCVFSYQSAAL